MTVHSVPTDLEKKMDCQDEYVILTAFSIHGEDSASAEMALQQRLPKIERDGPILSWWIAEDERRDGSDNDSAVFVPKGSQKHARVLLSMLRPVVDRCLCEEHSQDAGAGYVEHLLEYDPACPEHSDHLYDPRSGTWIPRNSPQEASGSPQATPEAF